MPIIKVTSRPTSHTTHAGYKGIPYQTSNAQHVATVQMVEGATVEQMIASATKHCTSKGLLLGHVCIVRLIDSALGKFPAYVSTVYSHPDYWLHN